MNYTELIERYDDPAHWDYPLGFDYKAATGRFVKFVEALSSALNTPLNSETGSAIQDASFHSQIFLPLDKKRHALIRFSNFGDMTTVSEDEPVPEALLKVVVELLVTHGYVYIPASVLEQPYTGKNPGVTGIRNWWIRYFDWV
jgi:hypothetical protein